MGRHKKNERVRIMPDFTPVKPPHVCDKEGCPNAGEYRAPKDRSLKSYYWFCLEHVKEYNAAWDYFKGMSGEEIQAYLEKDVIGQRPTWKLGERRSLADMYDDPLGMAKEAFDKAEKEQIHKDRPTGKMKPDEELIQAVELLEIDFPLDLKKVRATYKKLAKKYHPDLTGGDKKAEEKFKKISEAYRLITKVLKE